jgi:hypothetical protein
MTHTNGYGDCWYCSEIGIDLEIRAIIHAGGELRVPVCEDCMDQADEAASPVDPSWDGRHNLPDAWIADVVQGRKLPGCVFPGGYVVMYVEESSGDVLCPGCAAALLGKPRGHGERLIHGPYHEGPTEHCADCAVPIESDYGDPDAPDADE